MGLPAVFLGSVDAPITAILLGSINFKMALLIYQPYLFLAAAAFSRKAMTDSRCSVLV